MSRTVRLYPSTIERIRDLTTLPEDASFAQKASDVVDKVDRPGVRVVEIDDGVLSDIAARVGRQVREELQGGPY